jgi:4'-phosphopantetheinyl transferase
MEPEDGKASAFFRCWSRKEALLKARGDGIFGGLQSFAVNVDAGPARLIQMGGDTEATREWRLFNLPRFDEFVGAVAVRPIPGVNSPDYRVSHFLAEPELLLREAGEATNV